MLTEQKPPDTADLAEQVARLSARLERIERHLALGAAEEAIGPAVEAAATAPVRAVAREDFELVVGRTWFARVGIVVFACGLGFILTLPFPGLPAALPGLAGMIVAAGLYLVIHYYRSALRRLAGLCLGACMALLHLAALRLFLFGATPALDLDGAGGRSLLVAVIALNLALALRLRSLPHVVLAFATGYLTAALVGTPWFVFLTLSALTAGAVGLSIRRDWPALLPLAATGTFATHIYWAVGRPWSGRTPHFVTETSLGLYGLLAYIVLFATGPLLRKTRNADDQVSILIAVLCCGLGYVMLLVHTLAAFGGLLPVIHLSAASLFLGLAAAHWQRERSHLGTFLYAMTGYLALSVVILDAFKPPEVFLWLSLQSLVVVATALWFRSRFIVVGNFLIYLLIVAGYMFTAREEHGVSLVFGVVALVTARILNWQRGRLELQTDLMRNAYLAGAFVVFPYALYHLVPRAYVSVSWVGIALAYYALNLIVRNRKYRWMGHATLLLTVGYVLLIDLTHLAPVYRILSLMVLGAVLLVVSMAYSRGRARARPPATPTRPETGSDGTCGNG